MDKFKLNNLNNETNKQWIAYQPKKFLYSFKIDAKSSTLAIKLPASWFSNGRGSQICAMRLDSLVSSSYEWQEEIYHPYLLSLKGFDTFSDNNLIENSRSFSAIVSPKVNVHNPGALPVILGIDFHNGGIENEYETQLSQSFNLDLELVNSSTNTYDFPAGTLMYGTIVFTLVDN